MRMSMNNLKALALVAGAFFLCSCAQDMDAMRLQLNTLKSDYYVMQQSLAERDRATQALREDLSTLKAKTLDLPKADALSALRSSQTDLYAQVSDMLRDIQDISGRLDEIKFQHDKRIKDNTAELELLRAKGDRPQGATPDPQQMKALTERIVAIEGELALIRAKLAAVETSGSGQPAAVVSVDKGADALYKEAYTFYEAKQAKKARELFKKLISDYPTHDLAGNAYFWIGETFYQEKVYDEAILSYDDVVQKFPTHTKAPAAMLKQAYAFLELGDKKAAEGILRELMKRFPDTDMAQKAKSKLESIAK